MLRVFLCLALCLSVAAADCDLVLYIDEAASLFNVTGVANGALLGDIPLSPGYPQQRIGLQGTLNFRTAGGCPANNRQLRRVLSSGDFSVASTDDLRLYPRNATLQAATLAQLQFLDLAFGYRWRRLRVGSAPENIRSNTQLRVLTGSVQYTVNETLGFDVEPGEASLVNNTSDQQQEAVLSINGSRFQLDLPEAAFSFVTEVETGVELIPTLTSTLNLTGRLIALAFVECSEMPCGQNGRCAVTENGESICECACGWTGADCQIPSGFCDLYGDPAPLNQIMPQIRSEPEPQPAPVPAPATTTPRNLRRQCEALFSRQQCPDARSEFNLAQQACQCVGGWRGASCDICEAGSACPDFFEEGAACLVDGAYDRRSGEKIYECDMRSTGLDVFIGNSIKFVCNTTGPRFFDLDFQEALRNDPSISPINNTPFCTVDFNFQEQTPVNCTAWGCSYQPNSARVSCSAMLCDCEDCEAIESIVNGISSVDLDCNEENQCVVEFGGLSVAVEAPCLIGECLLPSNPEFSVTGGSSDKFEMDWDIFIISMPVVFLGLLLCLFGVPAVRLGFKICAPLLMPAATGKEVAEEVQRGAEISFENVSCRVAMPAASVPFRARWQSFRRGTEESGKLVQLTNQTGHLEGPLQSILNIPAGYKSVLHGVSGTVRQGKLMGVMGPSGGGKTTFLSIISSISAERGPQTVVEGKISINGHKAGAWAKRLVAFVPQDDKLIATLSVRECLMYSAILRKPGCPMHQIRQKVKETISELSLSNVRYSLVGGLWNKRGISGGERRRVTIGMELVIDPNLVILDEPTSGLDSFTALNLMHTLKSICQRGRTVILSVHQPTPAMLDMLDQVLLLAKGFQVYLGPPSGAAEFFAEHGFQRDGKNVHIAEFMLELVSNPETLTPLLNSIYRSKPSPREDEEQVMSPGSRPDGRARAFRRQRFSTAMHVLLWRGFLDIVRNPALLLAHVAVAVVIGVFCGGIFFDAPLTIEGAQNRLGAAFFVLAFLGFWSLTTIDLLHMERSIVAREVSSGYYGSYVYLISKIVLDAVLLRVVPAMLLSIPLYFMMQLQTVVSKIVIFLLTVATFNVTVGLLSMAITLLSPTPGTASLLINTVLLIGLLFAGHLVNIPSMPKAFRWLHHLSPFHYGFQVLAVNEMLGLRLNFVVPGYASVDGIGGDVFLRTVGIDDHDIRGDLIAFLIYYGAALVLTGWAMWFSLHFRATLHRMTSFFKRSSN